MFGLVTIDRSRRSPLAAPVVTAAGLAIAAGWIAVRDPESHTVTPPCPFQLAAGWWCPACGLTRSAHHLMHGEIVMSLRFNPFTIVIVTAIAITWWQWYSAAANRPWKPPLVVPRAAWVGILFAALAFGVLRNLPGFAVLRGGP